MTRPFNGPLGGVAEQRREPGTFRESLRLTDRRARAGDWQENRPIFTGWSGYPTQLVLCDRDGMTVRAADHRYTTSVRAGGLTLLPSARRPGGQRCGDPVPRAQVAEEVFGKPAAASSTFRMDNRRRISDDVPSFERGEAIPTAVRCLGPQPPSPAGTRGGLSRKE